ncbi:hypothetical protein JZ751_013391 [Albula glossodonta]|uniref:Uncharacterized protein n=1 Tax=Albula glossodonta TaxID=121402 RepID=A0A8T2MT27_9TELE|nr:hypothetical protein JZ751_013391 [Albula glossodonta]
MSAKDVSGETGYLCHRFKMEECMSPAEDNLSTHSELSASNDSLSDNNNTKEKGGILSGRFRLAPKPAEHSLPAQEKGGMFTGKFRKTPKPSGGPTPAQDNFTHSELSASNDSLSDNNTKINREVTQSECREDQSEPEHRQVCAKSDKGVFGGIFWKIPKERAATFTISRVSSTDSHSVELPQIHTSTDTCLEPPENKQEKGGKFTGCSENPLNLQRTLHLYRKLHPYTVNSQPVMTASLTSTQRKKGRSSLDYSENLQNLQGTLHLYSLQPHLLFLSNIHPGHVLTQKKGGKFTGLFRKSPKPAEDTAPVQEIASIHGELSASNDSLSDIDTKEIESIHGELSASNDSLSDIDTKKKKGGKFTGLFRKSLKPAEDTAPVQVTI